MIAANDTRFHNSTSNNFRKASKLHTRYTKPIGTPPLKTARLLLRIALDTVMEAASARMAARDRYGGFNEPATTPLQRFIRTQSDLRYRPAASMLKLYHRERLRPTELRTEPSPRLGDRGCDQQQEGQCVWISWLNVGGVKLILPTQASRSSRCHC